ncbi:hypothetical protein LN042_23035 [Kitasatospora sp. RB6PN24]|uniref:hypothetical protein n=1 Tax=Kitasatospora humi TaxID=2893891 RepID=UPI001E5F7EAF|nr:hypothetical protein [Kitasatospora humi]MCC9309911.1 hypothetical protein [Kitasatospora humi]
MTSTLPEVSVTAVYTGTGDPRIHRTSCDGWRREAANADGGSESLAVTCLSELAEHIYRGMFEEAPEMTAADFADHLSLAPCAVDLPHGAPDAERRFTRSRREQGFTSHEQLQAMMDYADHARRCAECPPPRPSILTGGADNHEVEICDPGAGLYATARTAGS